MGARGLGVTNGDTVSHMVPADVFATLRQTEMLAVTDDKGPPVANGLAWMYITFFREDPQTRQVIGVRNGCRWWIGQRRQAFLSADQHSSDKRGVSAATTLFQVFRRPHAGRGQGRAPRSPHRLPPTWPPRGSEQAASS